MSGSEARQRSRRRWILVGVVLGAMGVLLWALLGGRGGGEPTSIQRGPAAAAPGVETPTLRGRPDLDPQAVHDPDEPPPEAASPTTTPPMGRAVQGVVLDAATGHPLGGASVTLFRGGANEGFFEVHAESLLGQTRAAEDGSFRLEGVPDEGLVTVAAAHPGHARASQTLESGTESWPDLVEIRLDLAGRLVGRVHGADGQPAAGATVWVLPGRLRVELRRPGGSGAGSGGTWTSLGAAVAPDGTYAVEGLEVGAVYAAIAVGEDGARSTWAEDVVATRETPAVERELRLRALASLEVRVRGPDGQLVGSGARAMLFTRAFAIDVTPTDHGDGTFTFGAVPPETYTLRVDKEGLFRHEGTIVVNPGDRVQLDVRLEAGLALSGVLVDDLDRPIPGETLFVMKPWWRSGEFPDSNGRAAVDAEGRFRIEGLRPQPHSVGLVKSRYFVPEGRLVVPPDEDLRLVVHRPASLRARVGLPQGMRPPDGVHVHIWLAVHEGWPEGTHGWSGGGSKLDGDEGELRIDGIRPAAGLVQIAVAGCVPFAQPVLFQPGETLDLGQVELERGRSATLRIEAPSGDVVAGARIQLQGLVPNAWPELETGPDGCGVLHDLGPGRHEVRVEAEGFLGTTASFDGSTAPTEIPIRIPRGFHVGLRTQRAEHAPAAGVHVTCEPVGTTGEAAPDMQGDFTDDHGRAHFVLEPGRWRVSALDGDRNVVDTVEIEGSEGETREIDLLVPAR